MILDKTGTLTTGEFKVLNVDSLTDNYSSDDITALMAGIEGGSSHPIAQSIIKYAEEQHIQATPFESIAVVSGAGVEGRANGRDYKLISQKAYGEYFAIDIESGATLSILTENGRAIGHVALGDELKESSRKLIAVLKKSGIEVIMATGDNEEAAQGVAEILDIEYRANQSPEDKYALVNTLKQVRQT